MAAEAQRLAGLIRASMSERVFVMAIDGRSGAGKSTLAAFDGRLLTTASSVSSAVVVILEGAYSCRPELADVLDLRVLVETEPGLRYQRLRDRDGEDRDAEWFTRWDEAEQYYFDRVVTRSGFDLVPHP